jgi:hypothetical protein
VIHTCGSAELSNCGCVEYDVPQVATSCVPVDPMADILPEDRPGFARLTVNQLFENIRRREKMSRGRFKKVLRKAIRDGWVRVVDGPGTVLELSQLGQWALDGVEAKAKVAVVETEVTESNIEEQ